MLASAAMPTKRKRCPECGKLQVLFVCNLHTATCAPACALSGPGPHSPASPSASMQPMVVNYNNFYNGSNVANVGATLPPLPAPPAGAVLPPANQPNKRRRRGQANLLSLPAVPASKNQGEVPALQERPQGQMQAILPPMWLPAYRQMPGAGPGRGRARRTRHLRGGCQRWRSRHHLCRPSPSLLGGGRPPLLHPTRHKTPIRQALRAPPIASRSRAAGAGAPIGARRRRRRRKKRRPRRRVTSPALRGLSIERPRCPGC